MGETRSWKETSHRKDWQEVKTEIERFNVQMMIDGHDERFRAQVMKSVFNKWTERQIMDNNGDKSYYRDKKEREADQKLKNKKNKKSWFQKNSYEGVLKVSCTPNSQLAKNIKSRLRKEVPGRKIMVQELLGPRLEKKI